MNKQTNGERTDPMKNLPDNLCRHCTLNDRAYNNVNPQTWTCILTSFQRIQHSCEVWRGKGVLPLRKRNKYISGGIGFSITSACDSFCDKNNSRPYRATVPHLLLEEGKTAQVTWEGGLETS